MSALTRKLYAWIVTALCLVLTSLSSRGDALETWHWRSPLPQGNTLCNTAFVNGRFVAVGELGTVLTSVDGMNWARQPTPCVDTLKGCAYGNGVYVAVGDLGTVLVSPDGENWTAQYAGTFYDLNAVTFGDGQFVAVGEKTLIFTSPDGVNWTQRSSGEWDLQSVAYGPLGFVAVGGQDATVNTALLGILLTSADGRTWIRRVFEVQSRFVAVAYGGQTYAALSTDWSYLGKAVWWSTNLVNWEPNLVSDETELKQIAYGNGKWVVGTGSAEYSYYTSGRLHSSSDLKNWSLVATNYAPFTGIAFGNGIAVASTSPGAFLVSSNGLEWANPWGDPVAAGFRDLQYLNGHFTGVLGDRLVFSPDGKTWTNGPTVATSDQAGRFTSITYGNGLYLAGGEYRTIWASADGRTWTNPAPELNAYPHVAETFVAYGNGVFAGLSSGDTQVLLSADGLNWALLEANTNEAAGPYYRDLKFGNGRFIAASVNGVGTSADGSNWVWTAFPEAMTAVAAGKGLFLAAGYWATATSADGVNWQYRESNIPLRILALGFGGGCFVGVPSAVNDLDSAGFILVSSDGVNWSRRSLGTIKALRNAAYGEGTFVVSGAVIMQSDPFASLELSLKPNPELLLWGPKGRPYRIEYKDVEALGIPGSWKSLRSFVMDDVPARVTDTNAAAAGRFYRAVMD